MFKRYNKKQCAQHLKEVLQAQNLWRDVDPTAILQSPTMQPDNVLIIAEGIPNSILEGPLRMLGGADAKRVIDAIAEEGINPEHIQSNKFGNVTSIIDGKITGVVLNLTAISRTLVGMDRNEPPRRV